MNVALQNHITEIEEMEPDKGIGYTDIKTSPSIDITVSSPREFTKICCHHLAQNIIKLLKLFKKNIISRRNYDKLSK
jgi:hypothetical protein